MTHFRSKLEQTVEILDKLSCQKDEVAISRLVLSVGINYTDGTKLMGRLKSLFLVKFEKRGDRTYVLITQTGRETLRNAKQLLKSLGFGNFEEWET